MADSDCMVLGQGGWYDEAKRSLFLYGESRISSARDLAHSDRADCSARSQLSRLGHHHGTAGPGRWNSDLDRPLKSEREAYLQPGLGFLQAGFLSFQNRTDVL